jgi:hypothetical protein
MAVARTLVVAGRRYLDRWSRWKFRGLQPGRLRVRALRAAVAGVVVDWDGARLLPDRIEIRLTPDDLSGLGPVADWLCEEMAHDVSTLARERGYRLRAAPRVGFTATVEGRPGRPIVRTSFGSRPDDPPTSPNRPVVSSGLGGGAVLRRLEPPGRPLLLGSRRHARIGRTPQSDLVVARPGVSRCHASIYLEAGAWFVVDHGSTNGTLVNSARVRFPIQLAHGDEIHLGREVRIRFELNHLWVA